MKLTLATLWLTFSVSFAEGDRQLQRKSGKLFKGKTGKEGKSEKSGKDGKSSKSEFECGAVQDPDAEIVRGVLSNFVRSLDSTDGLKPSQNERAYHQNAEDQVPDWHLCTVVQQCLDPEFMLSLGIMPKSSRGYVYKALSKVLSQESYNMLQLQQHSNMLLGEMQDWATTCDGTCHELDDPDGLLGELGENPSTEVDGNKDYDACAEFRETKPYTFWRCNAEPRMLHQANIDTTAAKYKLGNIFNEPHIHGRNAQYDYFSVYGDLEKNGGSFGFRFSGHHLDLNFMWNSDGELTDDLPVFLGHNPLIVPMETPPLLREHNETADEDQFDHMLMWQNMAGVAQFAEGVDIVLRTANKLLDAPDSYIPLKFWDSLGYFGGLELKDSSTIDDYVPMDLSRVGEEDFMHIWRLIDYTLRLSRGKRSTSIERALFREEGKAVWTTSSPPEIGLPLSEEDMLGNLNFFYVRVETDEWVFFCMVNQLFTLVSESEATNHLHSILIKKSSLNCGNACCPGETCP